MITRAYENQIYVVSVNNADQPQTLPSMVVSPFGEVIYESPTQREDITTLDLELSQVRDDFINQERNDLVKVMLVSK